ncbi:hypothetical protein F1721_15910 [Saccharopolyspora hirsuta]|uniref:PE domain-containing protein n=1 Tax=Saccharopolyspora hirsuta TaxID=1837 RepID=A0A5M7BZ09_SACHI|nr:hypothetical protein [Saccharopolyspora hirsuta]KAA5832491.1 hypothetical protein F1721_15910 [Saccharopolyspora hirsuta]
MTEPVGTGAGAVAGLAASNDAMQGIISAANSGSFRVTPEAGDELIRIFEDFQGELGDMQRDIRQLARETPLGDSPAGQAISNFNKQVAAGGDGRSYEEMIRQMRERVPQVIEAIKKGIQTYQDVDEGNANFGVQA